MITNQIQAYQNNSITTASEPQLTRMCYNGWIKFIIKAIKAINEQEYETKNQYIQKAQDIIQELMLTLDKEMEISTQLMPLYEFINYQLQKGNIKSGTVYLEEARSFV